jgi:hypothetical protein
MELRMKPTDPRTVVTLIIVVAVTLFFAGRCSVPAPLPPKVQALVNRHSATSAVDTAATNRLEREKQAAHIRELAAADKQRTADSIAGVEHRRADSLATVAAAARTAQDSAAAWRAAYEVRTIESDSLRQSLEHAGARLQAAAAQAAAGDSISSVWRTRALRADTVIAKLVDVASKRRNWGVGIGAGETCNTTGCGPGLSIGVVWSPF